MEQQGSDSEWMEATAKRQLADYDARQPGSMFAEGLVLSVSEAYELQAAVAELRCRRGESIIGYKVGCTAPKVRAQLGIDQCISGRLYESEKYSSGATLSRRQFANLAIEGELAVELSQEPHARDFDDDGIPTCVARVMPVIELHHFVMRGKQPSAGELIANNAIHGGIVAGHGTTPQALQTGDTEPSLAIFANDRLLENCAGTLLIQTIRSSLAWLTEIVRDRGERLSAGQIVLTGSIPSLIPVKENGNLRIEAPPFGSVEATIVS